MHSAPEPKACLLLTYLFVSHPILSLFCLFALRVLLPVVPVNLFPAEFEMHDKFYFSHLRIAFHAYQMQLFLPDVPHTPSEKNYAPQKPCSLPLSAFLPKALPALFLFQIYDFLLLFAFLLPPCTVPALPPGLHFYCL